MGEAQEASKSPVVIRLQSIGLGNAFFQYAAAKAVANAGGGEVLFDISGCISSQLSDSPAEITRQEVLDHFSRFRMKFGFASPSLIRRLRRIPHQQGRWSNQFQRLVHRLGGMPRSYVKERVIHQFQPEILKLHAPVYLEGTFINPRYWSDIRVNVLDDLTCIEKLPEPLESIRSRMQEESSIAIHIRRGDYAKALTNSTYPLYGDGYVRRAVAEIERRAGRCRYYVFSDDPQWAQANILVGTDAIHVSRQSLAAWVDLELMSSCHHNVIGNSTFSWWGAYRNKNPNRVVVTPQKWRNDAIDTSAMLQDGWIALD